MFSSTHSQRSGIESGSSRCFPSCGWMKEERENDEEEALLGIPSFNSILTADRLICMTVDGK